MSKLFKPKTMRRIILFLLLILPFVYTILFALVYLHGHSANGVDFYSFIRGVFVGQSNYYDFGERVDNPWFTIGFLFYGAQVNNSWWIFEPIARLIRFVMPIMGFTNPPSIMADSVMDTFSMWFFGVLIYQLSVVLWYEIITIALKLLLLPLRAVEAFERKGDD